MHRETLTPPEQRVLGCLIEKRFTTPDGYPLSLNALRSACNQSTNRDPVVAYDEDTVYRAAQRLCGYGLARLASGHSSRATKYRHLAEESLGVRGPELAVLGVLLLRGAQTPGELKQRTERMAPSGTLDEVERTLADLAERGYARRLDRRPGQKEDRWAPLLGDEDAGADPGADARNAPTSADPGAAAPSAGSGARPDGTAPDRVAGRDPELAARVSDLEREVADLREQLAELLR